MANKNVDYGDLPPALQQVHWRVDKVEESLEKECVERRENDKLMFEKIDSMKNMAIYQLCAIILTLIVVVFKPL